MVDKFQFNSMNIMNTLLNNWRRNKRIKSTNVGFTLIEIMVSVTIFAIVMTISMGAILTIVNANRKAQSLKSVMNNLNFAVENMTRTIKTGGKYSASLPTCNASISSNSLIVGNAVIKGVSGNNITYSLIPSGQIQKQITLNGVSQIETVTSPEITIERLCFYVTGNGANDDLQPKVTMILKGYAGNLKNRSNFNLQTTVSQRLLDS